MPRKGGGGLAFKDLDDMPIIGPWPVEKDLAEEETEKTRLKLRKECLASFEASEAEKKKAEAPRQGESILKSWGRMLASSVRAFWERCCERF
jgi:hypothetical protein